MKSLAAISATVLVMYAALPASAQTPNRRYLCDLVNGSGSRLALEVVYEVGSNNAFLVGNAGISPLVPVSGSLVVSFVELLGTGAIQSTTIAPDGRAVHSRHSFLSSHDGGKFIQSQYTGTCRQ
jgi:hypothetical protein